MSTRCSIVYSGPIHIYAESNDGFTICISDIEGKRNEYNGDVTFSHEELKKIYEQLKDYYEKGPTYETP